MPGTTETPERLPFRGCQHCAANAWTRTLAVWLCAFSAGAFARSTEPPPFEPTSGYETRRIEGWTVLIHKGFVRARPQLADETLALLRLQLQQIVWQVPARAVAKLRDVRIWVEENEPHHPCMTYHPDAAWLRDHGMNPEKARCVEIANARKFLEWTREQPWMVLHELAHAYHHQYVASGYGNAAIRAAHERAIASKSYDSVLRMSGRMDRAYALTNPIEYFAEGTEALFGTNDFYPFVRAELERHDRALYVLLRRFWGVE